MFQIANDYNGFVKSIQKKILPLDNSKTIVLRFIVRITKKDYDKIIWKNQNKTENIQFYYSKSSIELLSYGLIKTLRLKSKDEFLSFQKNYKFITSKNIKSTKKIPLILSAIPFQEISKGKEWNDLAVYNFYIPKIFKVRINKSYFLVHHQYLENASNNNSFISDYENFLFIPKATSELVDCNFLKLEKNNSSKQKWMSDVKSTMDLMNERKIKKIVLSRREVFASNSKINSNRLLKKLIRFNPGTTVFGFGFQDKFFFGASPENLLSIKNNILYTEALAGSIKRSSNKLIDKRLSSSLLNSKKDTTEHQLVSEYIVKCLKKYSQNISHLPMKIKKLKNIQHLYTPIKARLKRNICLSEIIFDLFPTPAVCGKPKSQALKILNEIENFDRGLFTGLIGWFNFDGIAEYSVAIRSALIQKNRIFIYAGCGIVEGSNEEAEFQETKIKMETIKSLFKYENK
jgi:menaquinone-specific isochorismate synthase